jgi:hypothetical protein
MTKNPNLQFPADKNSTNYEATITFQALKLKTFDVTSIFGSLYQEPTTTNPNEQEGAAAKRADLDARISAVNGEGQGIATIDGTGQKVQERLQTATLFLPQAIQIVDGAAYDNIDLGLLGANTEAGMAAGSNIVGAVVKGAIDTVSSLLDSFKSGGSESREVARLAVGRAGGFIPNEQARGAIRSGTRTTMNPNTRAMFKSVPLREFTFTFKMIPTSRTETKNIKDIIKFFRTELYPEVISIGDIPAGYEFPNVFEIKMFYRNEKNGLATKILPSYLRNFSATYNSSGMGFLEGGDFTEVDISMTFVESSTLHKELVRDKDY